MPKGSVAPSVSPSENSNSVGYMVTRLENPAELAGEGNDIQSVVSGSSLSGSKRRCQCSFFTKGLIAALVLFLALGGTVGTTFFIVRSRDQQTRESAARDTFSVIQISLDSTLKRLRDEMNSANDICRVALSTAMNGTTGRFNGFGTFRDSQELISARLRALATTVPFIFGTITAARLYPDQISEVQGWAERISNVSTGSLNLTSSTASGTRAAPPSSDFYYPILYHNNLVDRALATIMVDLKTNPARATVINDTVSSGEIAATTPTQVVSLSVDSSQQQLLYLALQRCIPGLPRYICEPRPLVADDVLGLLVVAFRHQNMVDAVLDSQPYASTIALRISTDGQVVARHRWDEQHFDLASTSFSSAAFQDRLWTVEIRSTETLVSSTVDTLSIIILVSGLLIATIVTVLIYFFLRSIATAARDRIKYTKEALQLQLSARRDALFDFLRTTSHDLRTPLHAISMSVEELRAEHPDAYNTAPIRIVKLNTQLLGGMISNVLDMDNISRGKLDLLQDSCDLSKVFSELIEMMHVVARDKNITLTYEAPSSPLPFVVCDKMRILRCVQNVIGNAVKFTRRGGITLEVSAGAPEATIGGTAYMEDTAQHGSMASTSTHSASQASSRSSLRSRLRRPRKGKPLPPTRIWEHPEYELLAHDPSHTCIHATVTDTGGGMTPSQLGRCVVPFQRAAAKLNGGSGLGLHVVLGVCLAYRGRLQVTSEIGKGTQFVMSFILQTTAPSEAEHSVSSKRSSARTAVPVLPMCPPTRSGGHQLATQNERLGLAPAPRVLGSGTSAAPKLTGDRPCSLVVVDDQVTNAKLLKRQVERLVDASTVEVIACFDGEEVVELATQRKQASNKNVAPIRIIFMDYSMPGMDGLEATKAIRELWATSVSTPSASALPPVKGHPRGPFIVMLTANATTEDKTEAEEAGCNAFQPKPCSVGAIRRYLQQAGLHY